MKKFFFEQLMMNINAAACATAIISLPIVCLSQDIKCIIGFVLFSIYSGLNFFTLGTFYNKNKKRKI